MQISGNSSKKLKVCQYKIKMSVIFSSDRFGFLIKRYFFIDIYLTFSMNMLCYRKEKEEKSEALFMQKDKIMNTPTIRRMPTYLHKLLKMRLEGKTSVSSTELAEYMNIELIVVRKDIALTGISGRRRVGYDINELITYIKNSVSRLRLTK